MIRYSLGPNGGIMTSLNLFATSFDQVLLTIFHLKLDLEIHNLI